MLSSALIVLSRGSGVLRQNANEVRAVSGRCPQDLI